MVGCEIGSCWCLGYGSFCESRESYIEKKMGSIAKAILINFS